MKDLGSDSAVGSRTGWDLGGGPIWVAGHAGLLGSAVWHRLRQASNVPIVGWTSEELDLRSQAQVDAVVAEHRPNVVLLLAARVGGIAAQNAKPVDFLEDNLLIQTNVMRASRKSGVARLIFASSSSASLGGPMQSAQTAKVSLNGQSRLSTYAQAKAVGMELVEAHRRQLDLRWQSVVFSNLYGPNMTYMGDDAHVMPALVRRFQLAAQTGASTVSVWGQRHVEREFLHVSDAVNGLLHILRDLPDEAVVNVGSGISTRIRDLAMLIADTVGFKGRIVWDSSKPKSHSFELLDCSKLRSTGWVPRVGLREGVRETADLVRKNEEYSDSLDL